LAAKVTFLKNCQKYHFKNFGEQKKILFQIPDVDNWGENGPVRGMQDLNLTVGMG
jgi:hypothetical protein